MHDIARDDDFDDDNETRENLDARELITAAVAEAKRHVRRNELKTNSALDAISDWIEKNEGRRSEETKRFAAKTDTALATISDWITKSEDRRVEETKRLSAQTDTALDAISEWIGKSESQRAEETKRLATSQERVASAVRDALGLMTGRLNQIENLVAEAPTRAFEPIRDALGRLDDRVSLIEGQRSADEKSTQQFATMMDSLGQRLKEVVGKIDELADGRSQDDSTLREQRIAGIEAKLGTILQQLSRPSLLGGAEKPRALSEAPPLVPAQQPRPRVVLRSVTETGKLDAAIADIRRKQSELGAAQAAPSPAPMREENAGFSLTSLRAELDALAEQLRRIEKGRIDPDAFDELLSTTREVRRLLADPTMPKLTARLEQSVADLTRRVDALTTKVVDRSEITALTQAIADIRASLSEPRPGADASVVESRIDALSAKIDEVMREPMGLVGQHLADLSARLGQQTPSGVPNIAFTEIRDKLDRIVERADTRSGAEPAAFDGHALDEVKERLDRLSAKIEQGAPQAPDNGSIADLRERLDRLASSIEKSTTQSAPEKIDRVLRQIAANMDAARQSDPNLGMLQALERQIAAIAERVGSDAGSSPALAELERSVMRLFDELADTKAAALRAAEAASSGAASQHSETVATQQDRLGEEREMHSALDQMNQTLERIMTRLSSIEEHARPSAAALENDHLPELIGAERAGDQRRSAALARPPVGSASEDLANAGEDFELAAQRAPRGASTPNAGPAEPSFESVAASHEPLEPGSGRPQPALLGERAASPAAKTAKPGATIARQAPSADLSAAVGSGGAMSAQALIAAARRAAADTAARQGTSISASPASTAKSAFSSLKASAGLHKKPILLALIGLMVTFSAIGAGRLILGSDFPFGEPAPSASPPGMGSADGGTAKPGTPATGRSSSLTPPQKLGQVALGGSATDLSSLPIPQKAGTATAAPQKLGGPATDLSIPDARDVVGSIARLPASPASPAPVTSLPIPQKAGTAAAAAASPAVDPANNPDFIARLKIAADANDPIAEYELASRLYDGRGMPRDAQGAVKLFERAANQGLVPAQYRLANIYETGIGATKDLVMARAWFEKAADRGNAKAMHNVGVYLAQGIQGKPDYATAVTWFRKAADRNIRDSQFNLAILMARGLGTARDFKASYFWFAVAARDGDADSAKKRDEIATRLTTAELNDAKAAVASWKPIEVERTANEVDIKDIKWDRVPVTDPAKTSKL